MPVKTKTKTAPSTPRVRKFRAKRKIARLHEGRKSKWNLVLWALQEYYRDRDIDLKVFIPALDLYKSPVSSKDIDLKVFLPDEDQFLKALTDDAIEIDTVRMNQQDVKICRPKFLGDKHL